MTRIGLLRSCTLLLAEAAPAALAQEADDLVIAGGFGIAGARFTGALPGHVLSQR